MPLLSVVEAAIHSGFGIELIKKLTEACPKSGEHRLLPLAPSGGELLIDQDDLDAYLRYLREAWPLTSRGTRPKIPDYIKDDIRAESHYMCAICGGMENGEVAHLDPVSETKNNSPDNLLFLCPNHHTKYDEGYSPSNNLSRDVVVGAKAVKRASRRRMLRYEGNAVAAVRATLRAVEAARSQILATGDEAVRDTYETELAVLMEGLPTLFAAARDAASQDRMFDEADELVANLAPALAKAAIPGARYGRTPEDIRSAAANVLEIALPITELDEVDCPHCHGRGQTGLMGDLCVYCGGSCVVSHQQAGEYDRGDIDEVDCPHCHGRGQTGLMGDVCVYCGGSCVVSHQQAGEYDRGDIDEVRCPRCAGSGQVGYVGDFCALCKGRTVVTRAVDAAYPGRRAEDESW